MAVVAHLRAGVKLAVCLTHGVPTLHILPQIHITVVAQFGCPLDPLFQIRIQEHMKGRDSRFRQKMKQRIIRPADDRRLSDCMNRLDFARYF